MVEGGGFGELCRGAMHGVPRAGSHFGLPLVKVLARVDGVVLEERQQAEEAAGQQRAQQRAHPVDPMVAREAAVDHVGAQGAGWVERAARVVVACEG